MALERVERDEDLTYEVWCWIGVGPVAIALGW